MSIAQGSDGLLESSRFEQLSPKQQQLARYIAENPAFAAFASASSLADRAEMSTATVVRFAQALGFDGYEEFQQNIRHSYLRTLHPLEVLQAQDHNGREDAFSAQLFQDIENLRRALHSLHVTQLADIAGQIDKSRQTVVISSGSYSTVGLALSHQLRFLGYPVLFEDRGGPHLTAAIAPLSKNDLLIGISFWKGNREIVKATEWAASRHIPTIAITDTVYSPMAKAAHECVALPTEGVSFFQSMVAPLSIVYGIVGHLTREADEKRKNIMRDAEASYDLLDISFSK